MDFPDTIALAPIPVSPRRAAAQALLLQRKITAVGSIEAAIEAAVEAIYAATPDDPPSEVGRLRLLYQHAYSREELEGLVARTFESLGLRSP